VGKIWIVGLGPGEEKWLPQANLDILKRLRPVYLRTAQHPLARRLIEQGVEFRSFDSVYEEEPTFEEVYRHIVDRLTAEARYAGQVVYAVPGHPLVAEDTVRRLVELGRGGAVDLEILPAMSCLDAIFLSLGLDPAEGLTVLEAARITDARINPQVGVLVLQVYNRRVASEVKLSLAPWFGDEWPVFLVRAAGVIGQEKVVRLPLYEIDRQKWLDHLTSLYVPALHPKLETGPLRSFYTLVTIMARLRGPNGCPWDKAQTPSSLRRYLLEEAHEVLEALDAEDMERLQEELGDLLLQVVFHSRMAEEAGFFSIHEVIEGINRKMIRRHPHVFSFGQARTPEEVMSNWRKIKQKEKGGEDGSLFSSVPRSLPALAKAQKVQEVAASVNFDWPDVAGVWDKLKEEEEELRQAAAEGHRQRIEEEVGDLLFAAVNLARFLGVDAESALRRSTLCFVQRLSYMEECCRQQGKSLKDMTLDEMDALWEEAKKFAR
jgi:tetrapyrrole methylase family protein/MazG family protein